MNISVERKSNCEAKLVVEIPAEPVSEERRRIVQVFSKKARLPGFRPGKVPRSVIEKRFGEQITAELEHRLMQKALQEAAEQEDLRIIDVKQPEDTTHHEDGRLTFTSVLTVSPEFELPQYEGIVLQIPDRVVGEDDIESELENLRNRFADYTDVAERPLRAGDFAVITYAAQLDGKPLDEAVGQPTGYLAGGEGYWLKMEEGSILPGFSEALEGATAGETRAFTLTVPEEFAVEELRGTELAYEVTIDGIKEQILPELDDELAGQILPGSDLKGLRETIRGNLERHLNRQIQEFKVNQLLGKLAHGVSFELPAELVTAETQGQADEMVEQGMNSGMSEEEIEARQEEIFAVAHQRAQANLRTDFLLQRIAEAEEIEVTQDELANRVAALANHAKKPIRTYAKELKDSGKIRNVQHSLLLSKTIDFLLDHAKLEVVDDLPADEAPAEPVKTGSPEPAGDASATPAEPAEEPSSDHE